MRAYAQKSNPRRPQNTATPAKQPAPQNTLQRQSAFPMSAPAGTDFSRVPVRAASSSVPLQTKLTIGKAGDALEQEADRVAERVMRMQGPAVQPGDHAGESELATAPAARVQTKSVGAGGIGAMAAPPIVHDALNAPGKPLDTTTRAYFEPRFGHDFSQVRVHDDAGAAASAYAIGARAYAAGRNIVFADQEYAPTSNRGRRLLAHELAHVAQQACGSGNAGTVHRQMHEEIDDDPIRKALLGTKGDDPQKKAPPKDAAALRRDFLNLQLPPEHKVAAIPEASKDKSFGWNAPQVGGYKLGGGGLPTVPQDYEGLKKSQQLGDNKIEKKISGLGSYKNGAIGVGAKIQTPLSPLLKWIGKKLRGLNHRHAQPYDESANETAENPPLQTDKAPDADLLKFVHEAFARKKDPLFPSFGDTGKNSNMLLDKGADTQNPPRKINLHLPTESEKQSAINFKLFEEAGKENAGEQRKRDMSATIYAGADIKSDEITRGNFDKAIEEPTVGVTLRATLKKIIALFQKKKKKNLVDPFE